MPRTADPKTRKGRRQNNPGTDPNAKKLRKARTQSVVLQSTALTRQLFRLPRSRQEAELVVAEVVALPGWDPAAVRRVIERRGWAEHPPCQLVLDAVARLGF